MSQPLGNADEYLAGPDRDGVAGAVQDYSRFVCRLWARTPALDDQGRILGFDTLCTPYLQSLGEQPVPGSIVNQTFGTLRYRIWQQVQQQYSSTVFEAANVRADFVQGSVLYTGAPPPIVGNFPSCSNPNGEFVAYASWGQIPALGLVSAGCGNGTSYQNSLPPSGEAYLVVEFVPNGPPVLDVQPPTPQPGLPPLPPQPITVEGPFGSVDVDIDLLPDGRIQLFGPELDVTIDPFGGGNKGAAGDNNRLPNPVAGPASMVGDGESIEPPEGSRLVAVSLDYDITGSVPVGRVFATQVLGVDAYFPRAGRLLFEIEPGTFEGPYDLQLGQQTVPVLYPGGAIRASLELPTGVVASVIPLSLPPDSSGGSVG